MNREPIIIERTFAAPVTKVWNALTDKDAMKVWYFDLEVFKPVLGFEFSFMGGPPDGIQYKHLCKITDVVLNKKIAYSWRYEGYDGNSIVSFELFEEGTNTRVKLMHTGLESFPVSNPDFAKANFVEGWTAILGISLMKFLA